VEDFGLVDGAVGLVSMIVIAYLIGLDADKKGRSGLLWGLFAFFSCLIAVPLYFYLVTKDKE
jgi:hypothetical protein